MKKIILFFITVFFSLCSHAQRSTNNTYQPYSAITEGHSYPEKSFRTTAIGDTFFLSNIPSSDSTVIYTYNNDSGYTYGINAYNDLGYAERYDFNGTDSSVVILGVMAQFSGTVNPASVNTVNFMLWGVSAPYQVTATQGYSGYPANGYDTIYVPFTQLGIGIGGAKDTIKSYLFPYAYANSYSFYIGFMLNYNFYTLTGDTIGLASSKNGSRTSQVSTVSTVTDSITGTTTFDTLINVQNATQFSDFNWYDNYTQSDSLYNNLAIFPIVAITDPSGISSITRNNLSLYGNYPNPAANYTNIKFSILRETNVTIQLADMSGKIITTIQNKSLTAGEHIIPVSTLQIPSGNYLYIIHTSEGGAIAGQLIVIR